MDCSMEEGQFSIARLMVLYIYRQGDLDFRLQPGLKFF
jgi:hypothetical protein